MRLTILMTIVGCVAVTTISAAEKPQEGISLTVYTKNLALVREHRFFNLEKGKNKIKLENIPNQIEPASLHFKSLTHPEDCIIYERGYEYDLASASKLLSKYINKNIEITTKKGDVFEGKLLSYDANDLILSLGRDDKIIMLNRKENILNIKFPKLPEGLITKPTLILDIESKRNGRQLFEFSYLTKGISWKADYSAIVDEKEKTIDLDAWVTIDNKTGITYKNAKLKLIAGDIHRAKERPRTFYQTMAKMAERPPLFEEKPFFEYHLYALKQPVTIKDKQTKQIALLSADNIQAKKLFVFEGLNKIYPRYTRKKLKVKVKLELTNTQKQGLGIPLPKGIARVYKKDKDGSLEFIGEELIEHTPKGEKIRLYVGDAFDIVGERKQTASRKISNRVREESFLIKLRNHKKENVEVIVVERLSKLDWTIIRSSHKYIKKDVTTIEFKVTVPKNEEVVIDYTVRYRW